ncbi:MAG: (2Fe-2S)-binding protein [Puniceicoccales bacterium]|jgi:NADH-quinone oxidoreductase subunit G|nr:(2Fe-2S)-binding protein [Puniceicoccales bacterium]
MVDEPDTEHVTINVDGEDVRVPPGANLVTALENTGRKVPHYCYHEKLTVAGSCRMCLVETGDPLRDNATGAPLLDEAGKPRVGWAPKPVIACGTTTRHGLHVRLHSPALKRCREGITEFLLTNHPLDCPICDQAGECRLQEYAMQYGRGTSRYDDAKNAKPKHVRLGPRVIYDATRCILCSRCIRFCREVTGEATLGFVDRGPHNFISCAPGRELDGNYSLNTVDLCPVGALTSLDFRFKMRVWFLACTASICTESSVGVNTTIWSREGVIYRITPRRNDAVNDTWMPDSGRELYKCINTPKRLDTHVRDGIAVGANEAVAAAARLLRERHVAYVASSHLCVEEQALVARLASLIPGPVYLPRHCGENDGLLLSEDRSPNTRGALITGLVDHLPDSDLTALAASVERGEVNTLLVFREDITRLGMPTEWLRKTGLRIIYIGTHADDTVTHATVVLPGLLVFEKSGTFVNAQFRLQKFFAAVPGPANVSPEIATLLRLIEKTQTPDQPALSAENPPALLDALWSELGALPGPLHGIDHTTIPSTGLLLDGTPWRHLPFPETKMLHHAPAQAPARLHTA